MSSVPHSPLTWLNPEAAARLAWQAATLDERLAAAPANSVAPPDAPRQALLARWARLLACRDEAQFLRRLAWDGLVPADLARALTDDPPCDWSASWLEWLPLFVHAAAVARDERQSVGWELEVRDIGGDTDVPFADAWLPFIRVARAAVSRRFPGRDDLLHPAARADFERHLARELAGAGALVLLEEFQSRPGGYDRFIAALLDGGLAPLFDRFPALARRLASLVDAWVLSLVELLQRLEADQAALARVFGHGVVPIVGARPGVSDRHDGRRVTILQFEGGWRLVYKPRDLGVERAFNEFLRWCLDAGLPDVPLPLTIVAREGYGWSEFAVQRAVPGLEDVEAYYRSAGVLVCVAHVLRGHDLHGENIVATANGPVLVDAEALLQPVRRVEASTEREAETLDGAERDEPSHSCLFTGLITLAHPDATGDYYDVGGLVPARERDAATPWPEWAGLRTDGIRAEWRRHAQPVTANHVICSGRIEAPAAHRAAILEGFGRAYEFLQVRRAALLAPGGPLEGFRGRPVRVLFRESERYAALLRVLDAPKYWRRGIDRSIACDSLNRVFAREPSRPRLWPLVRDERESLERGDIPKFLVATDATALVSAAGERITSEFVTAGLDAVRARLGGLCEQDRSRQEAWLTAALAPSSGSASRPARTPPSGDRDALVPFEEAAERLGDELLARACPDEAGNPSWAVLGTRLDLYGGLGGLAVFFAALARTRGREWYDPAAALLRRLAADGEKAAATNAATVPGVGAASGLGSIVYALTVAGTLLGDVAALDASRQVARGITDARVEGSDAFDVADGCAGALLALIALHSVTSDREVFDGTRRCAERLVEQQVPAAGGCRCWRSPDGYARPGFAHGAAGAACALGRFAAISGWQPAVDAARAALAWERSAFSAPDRNWPAIRPDGGSVLMTAWCHGAAGIAIGRATLGDACADASTAGEIAQAIETTLAAGPARLDHLCCGTLSRAESALLAGERRGRSDWVEAARRLARPVAARIVGDGLAGARTGGFEHGLFQPGFFQGVSGIGYQLLRLSRPEELPSVAGFVSPAGRR